MFLSLLASSQPLSTTKQVLLLAITLGLWAFVVYIRFFATPAQLLWIGLTGIDKLAHLAGGLFIALGFEWWFPRTRLGQLASLIVAVAVGWEGLEFFFDVETQYFYYNSQDLWRLDTIGDLLAAFLGGYGYWVFFWKRTTLG